MDMFEPQDHPNVIPYPGAPPTPPYDNAGWTLAFQVGVRFDRLLAPPTGSFEQVTDWNVKPPTGRVAPIDTGYHWFVGRETNDAFRAINRLVKAGVAVTMGPPGFLIRAERGLERRVREIAAETGVSFLAWGTAVNQGQRALRMPRIGLWDQYGGSMPSGWTRWILEQFEYPFSRVFAQELDAGNLNARFDVLIFVEGAIPGRGGAAGGRGGRGGGPPLDAADVPPEYRSHLGRISPERTIPQLRRFVEAGGSIVAIGSSAENLAAHFTLPVTNHLVENGNAIPRSKYFVPGSVLTARVDTRHPAAAGMNERTDVFFDNSPVFRITDPAAVVPIAMFDTDTPLRSGWAWGQQYLQGGVIAAEAKVGAGRVLLFGPAILHRAQPHGTFKLLFNAIY
jgi:hypothetical protein